MRERARARVALGAIERNCRRLRRELSGGAELCAVVKADGYGHGAVASSRAALAGGTGWLAVATANEAAELRQAGLGAPLLVLGLLSPNELDRALINRADITVWSRQFLEQVRVRGRSLERPPRVHIKYDSGMGRLGEPNPDIVRDLVRHAAALDDVDLVGLSTHFGTADEPQSTFFAGQLERFKLVALPLREEIDGLLIHAANSAATLAEPEAHFDLVRCGVAVYGLDPFGADPSDHGLEPALELTSHLGAIKRIAKRQSVGYGRSWRAGAETAIGVIPIGYGDGVRRSLSNRGSVLIDGTPYPIVGAISMDSLTVDLGPSPDVQPGATVTLIGRQTNAIISCEDIARQLQTINYEVACNIAARVPRVYR